MATQLVWFKRDLRTSDHRPLWQAAKAGPCLCVYVYEPQVMLAEDFDPSHLVFINESLGELRDALRRLGGDLITRHGSLPDVFDRLHAKHAFETVWSHEETGNAITFARDIRVAAWAKQRGVAFREFPQGGVKRRLGNRDGWARIWQTRVNEAVVPEPEQIATPEIMPASEGIKSPAALGLEPTRRTSVQVGGESLAQHCLDDFLHNRGENYRSDMSSPSLGETGCSRLSPYLAYGNLSIRQVAQATQRRAEELRQQKQLGEDIGPTWLKSLSSYQSRLSWHCHFMQKLEDEPSIEFENMNRGYDGLREDEFDEAKFDAWCHGQTGYPLVDACMRALHETGWINFRMRAMLVSFAAYHLWLHWRRPALYMARLFLDYEPGIHFSQFQMQSGVTGINTIRIYSPIKQVADNDPQGVFIRRYVPELAEVPDVCLAEPHKLSSMEQLMVGCVIGKDYPAPIVDHKTAYHAAKDRIFTAKKSALARQEAQQVYLKHGSRKTPRRERK